MYEGVVQDLIDELGRLPGVGPKGAQRIAFHLLQADPVDVRRLADVLIEVKAKVKFCEVCFNVSQDDRCRICRDPRRDPSVLCVVEEYKDVVAIERTREYRGRYHVLGGAISPIDGIGPDQLRIRELMTRLAERGGHRGHPGHRSQSRGRGHRDLPDPDAEGDGLARDAVGEWTAGGRGPGVRRRGHPRSGFRRKAGSRMTSSTTGSTDTDETGSPEPVEGVGNDPIDALALDAETEEFAQQIADQVASFLLALRAIAREADGGRAISLLLLEISQVLLAGARLGAQQDFTLHSRYQPDVGPEPDLDELRMRLALMLDNIDTYSFVFDPYVPEVVESQLSDDLAAIATDLDTGLRHFRLGNVGEALWWWQFSYVSSWGNLAGAALNALLSVVAHDRLDVDLDLDADQVAAADAMLSDPE